MLIGQELKKGGRRGNGQKNGEYFLPYELIELDEIDLCIKTHCKLGSVY